MLSQKHTAQGRMNAQLSKSFAGFRPGTAWRACAARGSACAVEFLWVSPGHLHIARVGEAAVSRYEPVPVECDEQGGCKGTGFRSLGVSYRAQTMSDNEAGPSLHKAIESLYHERL